jgi:hypothetical protein|tara:strand:- start:601 stop:1473 length:873 start_codon:yes stop_codon:yes gene_type:complete
MKKELIEETHNDDIGTADFSFNKLIKTFEELPTVSLLREVATIVPMKMSTGNIINIRRNASTNSFETVEATLTINTASSNPIQSGLSVEAMTDLNNQYGLDGYKIAANLLKGIVDQTENDAFIVFLDANALNTTPLVLSDPNSAEPCLFEITQRVQELIIKMNTPNFRTFSAFAILPYKNAASISALSHYVRGEEEAKKDLILNKIGNTSYYVNPDVTATKVYVGLKAKDKKSLGASSIIMGTFPQELLKSTHVESFQANIGLLNRYATAMNPLHDTGSEMLMEFTIPTQ